MSAFSGLSGSYRVNGEMDENDCDCDVDGSFIIIPKHSSESEELEVTSSPSLASPLASMNRNFPASGTSMGGSSINVFELGQQAEAARAANSIIPDSAPAVLGIGTVPSKDIQPAPASAFAKETEAGICPSVTSITSTSTTTSYMSSVSEASSMEEANAILNELSMENRKLKDLLTEKNDKMKKDLDTYKNLQSTMLKMSSMDLEHKSKCEERLITMDKLRVENEKLKSDMSLQLQQINDLSAVVHQSDEDVRAKLLKQREELESSKQAEVDHLTCQVEAQNELFTQCNLDREQLKVYLRKREDELATAKASTVNASDYSELQKERDTLHDAFEYSKTTIEQLNQNRLEISLQISQLLEVINARDSLVVQLQAEIEGLSAKCTDLDDISNQKENFVTDMNERLKVVIDQLQQEVAIRENEILNERKALAHAKESLVQKDKESSLLHTRLAVYTAQEEEKELYRAQMEEYKVNFEAERKDCLFLKGQKDRLTEEVAHLKGDLASKITELENLHRAHLELTAEHLDSIPDTSLSTGKSKSIPQQVSQVFDFVKREVFGSTSRKETEAGSQASSAPPEEAWTPASAPARRGDPENSCPLCGKKFSTSNALVSHASHCGDIQTPFVFP